MTPLVHHNPINTRFCGQDGSKPYGERSVEEAEAAFRRGLAEYKDGAFSIADDHFREALSWAPEGPQPGQRPRYQNALGVSLARDAGEFMTRGHHAKSRVDEWRELADRFESAKEGQDNPYQFARTVMQVTEPAGQQLNTHVEAYWNFRRALEYNYHTPEKLNAAYFLNSANNLVNLARSSQQLARLHLAAANKLLQASPDTHSQAQQQIVARKVAIGTQAEKQYAALHNGREPFEYVI